QQDNELENFVRTPNKKLNMRLRGFENPGEDIKELPVIWGELFEYLVTPNFYVWCCSSTYDARLFQAFEYDAALIVHDKEEFSARLNRAVTSALDRPQFDAGRVIYYDDYTTQRDELLKTFSKHFRYLYQSEYRFVWKPKETNKLQPIFVKRSGSAILNKRFK
ncbi:MAG: hypothetical protein JJ858_19260, partial [Rhizobiaceae bacterium]|nr:hypothetical protein [Rhizobiaceae bacterium]